MGLMSLSYNIMFYSTTDMSTLNASLLDTVLMVVIGGVVGGVVGWVLGYEKKS